MTVLVAFATSQGSTQGIAQRIAERLRRHGLAARALSVTDVTDLTSVDAVVLGSAIHGGKWLPEAVGFVAHNTESLERLPVWLFSVSTLGDQESMFPPSVAKKLRAMRKETDEIVALRETLEPREHRNFAGAVKRSDWPATGRAFFLAMRGRYGDHRNWAAIDAWADDIAADLAAAQISHSVDMAQNGRSSH